MWLLPHDNLPVMSEVKYNMAATTYNNTLYIGCAKMTFNQINIDNLVTVLILRIYVTCHLFSCDLQDKKDNWEVLNTE